MHLWHTILLHCCYVQHFRFHQKQNSFINAGELKAGDKLIDKAGKIVNVICWRLELTDQLVKVYNFEVEDYHTYYVGNISVLVYNANYGKVLKMKIIEKGTKEWDNAVNKMKSGGKDNNFRVKSASDAKALLKESRGNMNRYKPYKETGKGFSFHPNESNKINAPHNDLPHIKWTDNTGIKGKGHIFFSETH